MQLYCLKSVSYFFIECSVRFDYLKDIFTSILCHDGFNGETIEMLRFD